MFRRYALYYRPGPGPLADLGTAWLGWDAATGRPVPHPAPDRVLPPPLHPAENTAGGPGGWPPGSAPAPLPDIAALTARPRRYGLHATLVPPFTAIPGAQPERLTAAAAALAAARAPVTLQGGLELAQMGAMVVLRPAGDAAPLCALAEAALRHLAPLRAPLDDDEIRRRDSPRLTPRQRRHLHDWGYPHVLGDFRFHITLTGPVPRSQRAALGAGLAQYLAPALARPFSVRAITLMGEDAAGYFHDIARFPLAA